MSALPSPIAGKLFQEAASAAGTVLDTIGNFFFPGSFGSQHSTKDLITAQLSPVISHLERQDKEIINNRAGINSLASDMIHIENEFYSSVITQGKIIASLYENSKITKISNYLDALHETFLGKGLSHNLFDPKFIKKEFSMLKAKLPPNFGLVTEKVRDFFGFEYDVIVPNETHVIIAVRVPIYHLGQVYTSKSLKSKPIQLPNSSNFVNVQGANDEVILSFNKQNPNLFFETSKAQIADECFRKYGYIVCPNFQTAREDSENSCLYAIHKLEQGIAFKNCKLVSLTPNVEQIRRLGPNQFEVYFPKTDFFEHICPGKLPETLQLFQQSKYISKLEIGEGCEAKIGKVTLFSKLDFSANETLPIPFNWNNELLEQTLANLTESELNNETLIESTTLPSLNKSFAGPDLTEATFISKVTVDPLSGSFNILVLLLGGSLIFLLCSNCTKNKTIADLNTRLAKLEAKMTPLT